MNLTKADKAFSEYIRRRDAVDGYVKCCTCPAIKHWKQMDCGHYYSRIHLSVRWDEMNAHAQCTECNRHKFGSVMDYIKFMDAKYSIDEMNRLHAKRESTVKLMQFEIDELTEHYKAKIKEL